MPSDVEVMVASQYLAMAEFMDTFEKFILGLNEDFAFDAPVDQLAFEACLRAYCRAGELMCQQGPG